MYGDPYFKIFSAGCIATSAAGLGLLFQGYQGLSALNNDDVIKLQVFASDVAVRIGSSPNILASNNLGLRVGGQSMYEFPPLRVGDASALTIARESGTNASLLWTIWTRPPL